MLKSTVSVNRSISWQTWLCDCFLDAAIALCTEEAVAEDDGSCDDGGGSIVPPALFIMANVIKGVGNSAYYTLGMAYLDDNALKNKSPVLMGNIICVNLFYSNNLLTMKI